MYNDHNASTDMTPDEKMDAVANLKQNMEENFVQLGQLLSDIRRTKLFKFKGYKTFKEFVENEFNMSGSFAAKIISNFDLFIRELDVDEHSAKEIGLDKLNMIKPLVKQSEFNEKQDWIKKAQELPTTELRDEIKDGIVFWGLEHENQLAGVMGIQDKGDVVLIRHAYVRTHAQKLGTGTRLLHHLESMTKKPILIGTWASASWAILFYEKNGYTLVTEDEKNLLLRRYWSISDRQVETSVVLANQTWFKTL